MTEREQVVTERKVGARNRDGLTSRGGGVTDRERGCQRKETEEKCSAKDRAVVD